MRDSIGGVYSLGIVFMFIIIISGFLAFSVNYNKAFKMKNRIVTILEKYDNNPTNSEAQNEIKSYASTIGYSVSKNYTSVGCNGTSYTLDSNNTGWCYKINNVINNGDSTNGDVKEYTSKYIDVKTFVSIDVPVLNNLFPNIRLFTVTGSTKQIMKLNK